MDIRQNFTSSYEDLLKNKIIVLPTFAVSIMWTIAFVFFLLFLGIIDDLNDFSAFTDQYYGEKGISQPSTINDEALARYSEASDSAWANIKTFVNTRNIIMLVIVIFILALISYYISCLTFVLVAMIVKKSKLNWSEALKLTNKIFWRYNFFYLIAILIFLLYIVVMLLILILSVYIMKVKILFGIILIIVSILLALAVLFYFLVRLTFAVPILFLENKTAYNSLKDAFISTKNRFKETAIVFGIYVGISIAFGFVGNVFFESMFDLAVFRDIARLAVIIPITILFYILSSFIHVFSFLFLFDSYIDFKKSGFIKQVKTKR
ncbi:MAG: hypothetical protein AABX33_07410 [Nanoarchaeota archaeon]